MARTREQMKAIMAKRGQSAPAGILDVVAELKKQLLQKEIRRQQKLKQTQGGKL